MATLTVLSREIRSRRAPARSAPALLVGLLAASLAKVSDLADRASYPVSPPAARTKRCIAARKTSWSSTPGGASPACTAPAESPDTRAAASTNAPAHPRKCTNIATLSGTASCVLIVNNSHRAGEAQLHGPVRNLQCILGIFHAAAQHRVDVHLEYRVLRQHHQPAIQRL